MRGLLRCALESPDYLRDIADTLIQLKNGGVKTANDRAVALDLITAYESCDAGLTQPSPRYVAHLMTVTVIPVGLGTCPHDEHCVPLIFHSAKRSAAGQRGEVKAERIRLRQAAAEIDTPNG